MDKQTEEPIMVSICCLVYNHAPYLRQCLDGFVMQKTTFPIEILVHDDASTDGSADIIREYTAKYPHLFKPIYQAENQYSKGTAMSATYQFPRVKGKYIAMCEGDDYWTDPYKLQKQVDFMESHSEYVLCFHSVKVWKQQESVLTDDFLTKDVPATTTYIDLVKGNYIHTPSVVFRCNEEVFAAFKSMGSLGVGDYPLWMLNSQYGKIYKFAEPMGVYRAGSGIWYGKQGINHTMDWMLMLSKLAVAIHNEELKKMLDDVTNSMKKSLVNQYNGFYHSTSYRVGHTLIYPFIWLKKLVKGK